MKKLILVIVLIAGFSSNYYSQKDTIIQASTGYDFEMYNVKMLVGIDNDTVATSFLVYAINRLEWGDNYRVDDVDFTIIGDSVVNLFSGAFEHIVSTSGAGSYTDNYAVFDLNKIEIQYFQSEILFMFAYYTKNDKSPNGILTDRFSEHRVTLNQTQIDAFKVLLDSQEIKDLYLGVYNDKLGN